MTDTTSDSTSTALTTVLANYPVVQDALHNLIMIFGSLAVGLGWFSSSSSQLVTGAATTLIGLALSGVHVSGIWQKVLDAMQSQSKAA